MVSPPTAELAPPRPAARSGALSGVMRSPSTSTATAPWVDSTQVQAVAEGSTADPDEGAVAVSLTRSITIRPW